MTADAPVIGEYVAELLPCPFCGSKAEMMPSRDIQDTMHHSTRIECTGCEVAMDGPWWQHTYPFDDAVDASREITAKHELANRWNTRA